MLPKSSFTIVFLIKKTASFISIWSFLYTLDMCVEPTGYQQATSLHAEETMMIKRNKIISLMKFLGVKWQQQKKNTLWQLSLHQNSSLNSWSSPFGKIAGTSLIQRLGVLVKFLNFSKNLWNLCESSYLVITCAIPSLNWWKLVLGLIRYHIPRAVP